MISILSRHQTRLLMGRIDRIITHVSFLLLFSLTGPAFTEYSFRLTNKTLTSAEKNFGPDARGRLVQWEELIRSDGSKTDREKLEKVNTFFNQMLFIDDILHWKQVDYWATPVEMLASGGGDCEDFFIAKYFTLQSMGLSESKLNLTYVKSLKLNQAHMVLTYFSSPGAEPLVLDNLTMKILPASQRADLLPVYSFNGAGLWVAKQRGRGKRVGTSDRLHHWKNVLNRMAEDLN